MKKKSETFLSYNLVFIIASVIFLIGVGLVIVRYETHSAFYEQVYAKQLALIIDKAEAGMEIEIDITHFLNHATKNRFDGTMVSIDNNENTVTVHLIEGGGYSHYYFNDVDVIWNVEKEERGMRLTLTFVEPSADSADMVVPIDEAGGIQ